MGKDPDATIGVEARSSAYGASPVLAFFAFRTFRELEFALINANHASKSGFCAGNIVGGTSIKLKVERGDGVDQ